MTPLQAAKEHCANYDNGACLGIYYKSDLSIDKIKYLPLARCLLAEPVRPCPYFEGTTHVDGARSERKAETKICSVDRR
jgi:hypothetical protein